MAPARKNKKAPASKVEVENVETDTPATNGATVEQNSKEVENNKTFVVPKKIVRKGKQRTATQILESDNSPDKTEEPEVENEAEIVEKEPATNGEKNEKTKQPTEVKKETKVAKRGRPTKKVEEAEQESPEKKAKIVNEEKPKRGRRAKVASKNDENNEQKAAEKLPIEEQVAPVAVAKMGRKTKKGDKLEINDEDTEKAAESKTVVDAKKKTKNGRQKATKIAE